MTEKEKMLAHELYDANFDVELAEERAKCKNLCFKFNNVLRYDDFDGRVNILSKLFGRMGNNVHIEPPFWCDYGWNIRIGDNFYSNQGLTVLDAGGVEFGDNVFLGPHCGFYTSGHPFDAKQRNIGLEYAWPISIGNNVWMGAAVHVLPGVAVGDNSIIGAGSIVTQSIPSDCLAVGNPCRVVRQITNSDMERKWHFKGF